MLGWMLRRGLEHATGVPAVDGGTDYSRFVYCSFPAPKRTYADEAMSTDEENTQLEAPETPAPVFAARALKSAIFGEQKRCDREDSMARTMRPSSPKTEPEDDAKTPTKPQGILLTPGTGTSRRKRVSFGHDVVDKGPSASSHRRSRRDSPRKRTRLTAAMEQARHEKPAPKQTTPEIEEEDQDDWEEEDDDDDEDNCCTHDVTVDLNEPHSRSGKYWKSNFEKYHEDAKSEMEKLLKYKQLAKSYAKMKDEEALDMHEKLRDEQEKVTEMERKITEMAAEIANKKIKGGKNGTGGESPRMMRDLARQTALAVEYRSQVKELERLLKEKGDGGHTKRIRDVGTSPRTAKSLLDTQRELRKARVQLRESDRLKDEVKQLKSDLRASERKCAKLADDNKRLTEKESGDGGKADTLRNQLREFQVESRKKDEVLRRLRKEYEQFRAESTAQQEDMKHVLEQATDKISDLKKEIRALKAVKESGTNEGRPRSYHAGVLETRRHSPEEKVDVQLDLRDLARLASVESSRDGRQSRRGMDESAATNAKPRVTADHQSRTLREKFFDPTDSLEVDIPATQPPANILADNIPHLERPKWQPYVPRSPRNRAYLKRDHGNRAGAPSPTDNLNFEIYETQPQRSHHETGSEERHLALPDMNSSALTSIGMSRGGALPPERRAAALARIEQRKAEKRKADREKGFEKENMRPHRPVEA